MQIRIASLEALPEAARTFKEVLGEHRIVAFYGSMGAGKTTFIRALCEELGVQETVNSPTFALVNEYYSTVLGVPVYHFDFYRISKLEEVYDMGYEEYLYGEGLSLIEWPELMEDLLPDEALRVELRVEEDGSRTLTC